MTVNPIKSGVGVLLTNVPSAGQVPVAASATSATWRSLGLVPTATKTGTYTAAAGELVLCNATAGGFTVNLPTTPALGSRVNVKKLDSTTNAVTVTCGGSDLIVTGVSTTSATASLAVAEAREFVFDGTSRWIVAVGQTPLGTLDARYDAAGAASAAQAAAIAASVPESVVTAKGDILAATSSGVVARLAVGSNNQVLTADSAQTAGVKWAAATGGGDASTNTATSVDGEIALFSGTAGKTLKRGTGTGLLLLGAGVASIATAGTDYAGPGAITPWTLQSGRYYRFPKTGTLNTATMTTGTMRLVPYWISSAITLSRLGAEVTGAGDAGSKVRLGIYADDGTGRPGTLILDAGTIAGDTGAVQEITISQALSRGWVWFAAVTQIVTTTQPTMRAVSTATVEAFDVGTAAPAGTASYGAQQTSITAALPGTFAGVMNSALMTAMFGKVA